MIKVYLVKAESVYQKPLCKGLRWNPEYLVSIKAGQQVNLTHVWHGIQYISAW